MVDLDSLNVQAKRLQLNIPDAKSVLWKGLTHCFGENAVGMPAYAKVAEWMGDNHGKGLLLMGHSGLGKSTIAMQIMPLVIQAFYHLKVKTISAYDINNDIDEVKKYKLLVVDDVGVESPYYNFGNRRDAFNEIVDAAEQNGRLLILTTNLNSEELLNKYGERTVDRLRGMMHKVVFTGISLRKKYGTDI